MKYSKRVISLVLTAFMLCGTFDVRAYAADVDTVVEDNNNDDSQINEESGEESAVSAEDTDVVVPESDDNEAQEENSEDELLATETEEQDDLLKAENDEEKILTLDANGGYFKSYDDGATTVTKTYTISKSGYVSVDWGRDNIVPGDPHYALAGWARNPNATEPDYDAQGRTAWDYNQYTDYRFSATLECEDITLYAVWVNYYDVAVIHGQGGTFSDGSDTDIYKYHGYYSIDLDIEKEYSQFKIEREGYVLEGWYKDEDCTVPVEYYDEKYVSLSGDIDIYAKWIESCTVTFDFGDGTPAEGETGSRTVGKGKYLSFYNLSVPENPTSNNENKAFAGWYSDPDFKNKVDRKAILNLKIDSDVTFYAKYENSYTVTFEALDGSFIGLNKTSYSIKVPEGQTIGGKYPNVDAGDGLVFRGWFTEKNGDTVKDSSEIDDISEFVVTEDMTLYAGYTECYTITFHTNMDGVSFSSGYYSGTNSDEMSDTVKVKVEKGKSYKYKLYSGALNTQFKAPFVTKRLVNGKLPITYGGSGSNVYSTTPDGSGPRYAFDNTILIGGEKIAHNTYVSTGFVPTKDMDLYVVWGDAISANFVNPKGAFPTPQWMRDDYYMEKPEFIDMSEDCKTVTLTFAEGSTLNDVYNDLQNYTYKMIGPNTSTFVYCWCRDSKLTKQLYNYELLEDGKSYYACYDGSSSNSKASTVIFDAGEGYFPSTNSKAETIYYQLNSFAYCYVPVIDDDSKAFYGWYTDPACTKFYSAGDDYFSYSRSSGYGDDSEYERITYVQRSRVTINSGIKKLYAGYGPAKHVTLNANGGYFDSSTAWKSNPTSEDKEEKTVELKENHIGNGVMTSLYTSRLRRTGSKVFAGWYKDAACTQKARIESNDEGEFYYPESDGEILYAKWSNYELNDISIDEADEININVGEKYQLNVVTNASNYRWGIQTYSFTENDLKSNPTYRVPIKLGSDGVVTGNAAGYAVIYAEANGVKSNPIKVIVRPQPNGIVFYQSNISLTKNSSYELKAYGVPSGSENKIKWASSNPSIVKVAGAGDTAVITSLAKDGKATVTATYGGKKATLNVEVFTPVTLDYSEMVLTSKTDATAKLSATLGAPVKDKTVIWTSSDESVVAVNGDDTVATLLAAEGLDETKTVVITAKINGTDYSESCVVTVNPQAKVAAPTADVATGTTILKNTKVQLASSTLSADIYYTLDGSEPTTESDLYTDAITIWEDTTIKAIAVRNGYRDSDVVEFNYSVDINQWGDIPADLRTRLFYDDSTNVPDGMWYLIGGEMYEEAGVTDYTVAYNGDALTFNDDISVYQGTTRLVEKRDYTVAYANNKVVADTDAKRAPTVNILAKGNYSGKAIFKFTIEKADIADAILTSEGKIAVKIGKTVKLGNTKPTYTYNGKKLTYNRDYLLKYYAYTADGVISEENLIADPAKEIINDADLKYYIVPVAKNGSNFKSEKAVPVSSMVLVRGIDSKTTVQVSTLSIAAAKGKSLKMPYNAEEAYDLVSLLDNNGADKNPTILVKSGRTVLTYGVDYKVEAVDGMDYKSAGKQSFKIVGLNRELDENQIKAKEKSYSGSKTFTFEITGTAISKAKIAGLLTSVQYTGNVITMPELFNPADKNLNADWTAVTLYTTHREGRETIKDKLIEGRDYEVEWHNNGLIGNYTLIFKGINGFTGTIKKTIKITAFNMKNNVDGKIAISVNNATYVKTGAKPSVTVTFDGVTLKEGVDYKLAYKNNAKIVADNTELEKLKVGQRPTVTVTGLGNFTGSNATATFCIAKADITKNVSIDVNDVAYNARGAKKYFKKAVTGSLRDDGKGISIGPKRDIEKITNADFVYTYGEDAILTDGVTYKYAGDVVGDSDKVAPGTLIKVSVKVKCSEFSPYYTADPEGTVLTGYYRVIDNTKNIASYAVKVANPAALSYSDGKSVVPLKASDLIVYKGKVTNKLSESNYEIVSIKNNKLVGNATLVIRGKGEFGGTKTVTIKINKKAL